MASRPSASQLQQGGATGHQQSQALLELTSVIPLPGSGFGCVVFCKSASYIYSHALHTTTRPTHIHTPYTQPHALHTSTRPTHIHTPYTQTHTSPQISEHKHTPYTQPYPPTHARTHAPTHAHARAHTHTLVSGGTSVRIRFGSPFSSKVVVCGHCRVTLSFKINGTLKRLSSLPILMQESFWW